MNTVDFVNGAKALVPNAFRPIHDKQAWGQPLLSTTQFVYMGSAVLLALISGLLLYYSFYVAFILSSVETFEPLPPQSKEKRIAGSYHRTMRHMSGYIGLGHFIGGVRTYIWTALLAYVGRQALTAWVLSPTPTDTSLLSLIGGPDMISAFLLEPFNIVFTHYILTASRFSTFGTLGRLFKTQELYTTLVYIASIRMATNAFQSSLMVSDMAEHYQRPFTTFTSYTGLFLFRIALITRAHASLLPAGIVTTVDMVQPTQYGIGLRLWKILVRTLWMFKLLVVCVIMAFLHLAVSAAALLYASGQHEKVIAWVMAPKQTNSGTRPPHVMMGFDPEADPHHRH